MLSGERRHLAEFLRVLAEIEDRRIHLELGFSSLFAYCVEGLRLSEDQAYRRVAPARAGRRFPAVLDMIAAGEIHMTGVAKLAKHLTPDNHPGLLSQARHKTKAQIELLIASEFPAKDVTTSVRRVPRPPVQQPAARPLPINEAQTSIEPDASAAPVQAAAPAARKRPVVMPTSADAYSVRFTASARGKALLDQAKDLLAHQDPNGDVGAIIELGLEALVEKLEKKKWKKTDRPKAASCPPAQPRGRSVPHAVVREVHERDGGRCTYFGPGRRRCRATSKLELDHIRPFALGGSSTAENIRLRCRAHNVFAAERTFGRETMERYRLREGKGSHPDHLAQAKWP